MRVRTNPDDDARYRAAGWWSSSTLSERVAALARSRPKEDAYRWGSASLTWLEYDELADRVARRLVAAGLGRGDRALVWLPDGGSVHGAFLGCERAGVVAVGAGWRAGRKELSYLVERTGATGAVLAVDTCAR